jgi:hypothetical protein
LEIVKEKLTKEEDSTDLIKETEVQQSEDYGAKGAVLKTEYTLEEMMRYAIEDAYLAGIENVR